MGQSNYETVTEVHLKLSTNAASIHANILNGLLGMLLLTVNTQFHTTVSSGVPLVPPLNTGQHTNIHLGASKIAIA